MCHHHVIVEKNRHERMCELESTEAWGMGYKDTPRRHYMARPGNSGDHPIL